MHMSLYTYLCYIQGKAGGTPFNNLLVQRFTLCDQTVQPHFFVTHYVKNNGPWSQLASQPITAAGVGGGYAAVGWPTREKPLAPPTFFASSTLLSTSLSISSFLRSSSSWTRLATSSSTLFVVSSSTRRASSSSCRLKAQTREQWIIPQNTGD